MTKMLTTATFEDLPELEKARVLQIMANYHIRNGVRHSDGSIGEIKITPKQFKDLLAFVILSKNKD